MGEKKRDGTLMVLSHSKNREVAWKQTALLGKIVGKIIASNNKKKQCLTLNRRKVKENINLTVVLRPIN